MKQLNTDNLRFVKNIHILFNFHIYILFVIHKSYFKRLCYKYSCTPESCIHVLHITFLLFRHYISYTRFSLGFLFFPLMLLFFFNFEAVI